MRTLKISEITVGAEVVFVDAALNVDGAHVPQRRASVPLDGRRGVVVRVDSRTECSTGCASRAGGDEHPGCDCGYEPGKQVTIALEQPHPLAHSCDGFVPIQTEVDVDVDGETVKRIWGHGVWARPEHLYTPDLHTAHKTASAEAIVKHAARAAERAAAADVAKKYLKR
jgi:hypothetical protein